MGKTIPSERETTSKVPFTKRKAIKVKKIELTDPNYGCYRVKVGCYDIGSFYYDSNNDEATRYTLSLNLVGIKKKLQVKDQDQAFRVIEKAVIISFTKLIEI